MLVTPSVYPADATLREQFSRRDRIVISAGMGVASVTSFPLYCRIPVRQRSWSKRLLLALALLLALVGLFLTGGSVLLRGTPDFYKPNLLTSEQREAAAHSAEEKFLALR